MSSEIRYGDTVIVLGRGKWARMGEWKVVKVNPTTYRLQSKSQPHQFLRAGHDLVAKVEHEDGETRVHFPEKPKGLRTGAIVTVKRMLATHPAGTPFVVIKMGTSDCNIVPVGGEEEHPFRYWKMGFAEVTVIKLGV